MRILIENENIYLLLFFNENILRKILNNNDDIDNYNIDDKNERIMIIRIFRIRNMINFKNNIEIIIRIIDEE